MKKNETLKMGGGKAILTLAIAAMFAVTAFAVISFSVTDECNDDAALGASATLSVTNDTTSSDIQSALDVLVSGDTLTVTGSMIFDESYSTGLYLYIPEGVTVYWNAILVQRHNDTGLGVADAGTFIVAAGMLDIPAFYTHDTATGILNGNHTWFGTDWSIDAQDSSTLIVNGNLTVTGESDTIGANGTGTIFTVNGDLSITGADAGLTASYGGIATVSGKLTVPNEDEFVNIGGAWFEKSDFAETSSKEGYYEYTDGTSSVFVNISANNAGDDGNNTMFIIGFIVGLLIVVVVIVVYFMFIKKK
jgi:hypothetical protein